MSGLKNRGAFTRRRGLLSGLFGRRSNKGGSPAITARAVSPVLEMLEGRQLFAATLLPEVTSSQPSAGARNVDPGGFIGADVHLPYSGEGISASSLSSSSVKLYRTSDRKSVAANLNTSGGGDAIVLQPTAALSPNTQYTFEVTSSLKDTGKHAFKPYKITFTTGKADNSQATDVKFDKVKLDNSSGKDYSSVTIGPDHRLYAGTLDGKILRFDINADGTLGKPTTITTVNDKGGSKRLITGLKFDPSSTADNLILWVTHGVSAMENAADWTGKLSRLTGNNLQNYQDYVTNLPRSVRDHLTNQFDFGPDGAIYFDQASETAMGAPDNAWGNRPEHLMSAAIIRVDVDALEKRISAGKGAINVRTVGDGGSYDPYADNAAVTIYATGVRNAYDVVWTSKGFLFAPTNGSAAGGNIPGTSKSTTINNVKEVEADWLFRIKEGKYYGHPNETRDEYIFNGGNPTSGSDKFELKEYPVGTRPDSNWDPAVYNFGAHYSPDGVIEYTTNTFGGALKGTLMVCRYSGGDDILVIHLNNDGTVKSVEKGLPGMTGFVDPIDLIEDKSNGSIYVAEEGGKRLTLLRPHGGAPTPSPTPTPTPTPTPSPTPTPTPTPTPSPTPTVTVTGFSLYDADSDQLIGAMSNDMAIDLTELSSPNLSIKALTTDDSSSVLFTLDGIDLFTDLDGAPFSIAGDQTLDGIVDFAGWTPTAGTHTLIATPFASADGTGKAGTALSITFTVYDADHPAPVTQAAPLSVTGLTLMNADTDQPIAGLTDGMTINLNQAKHLNVLAQVTSDVTSVRFGLDGSKNFRTESSAPFALAGNDDAGLRSWTPTLGTHTLTVTAFAGSNASGKAGTSFIVKFTVVNQVIQPTPTPTPAPTPTPTPAPGESRGVSVTSLKIVRADTGATLATLTDGMTLDFSKLPTTRISILANVSGSAGSVKFGYDKNASYKIENKAPFAIAGDLSTGGYIPWTPSKGSHTLTVAAYSAADAQGATGKPVVIRFKVI